MPLVLVHLPTDETILKQTASHWEAFLTGIAKRSRRPLGHLIAEVRSGETELHVAWDDAERKAHALAGTQIVLRGEDRIGVIRWLTGAKRDLWLPLFTQLETHMRDRKRCAGMRNECRPGWKRTLQERGYRLTHLVMEKDF